MLDYDREADRYDDTRGGVDRARAAATAVIELVRTCAPPGEGWLVDAAGGTGIVTAELARAGARVLVLDRSVGMLAHAVRRVPGRVVAGDATRVPVADASVSTMITVWLLHLLDDAEPVIAEAARLLVPGGVLITTVDKDAAGRPAGSAPARPATDAADRVHALGRDHGLTLAGGTTFVGHGQSHHGGPEPVYSLVAYRRS